MARPLRLLVLGLGLGCVLPVGACQRFPGHPVRLSAPRLAADSARPDPGALPEPAAPDDAQSLANLFLGIEGIRRRLESMRQEPLPTGQEPRWIRLPQVAASVKRRFARGGFGGAVRNVVILGVTGKVPVSPLAMAKLIMDPEAERAALGASTFRRVAVDFDHGGMRRERNRAELLGVGLGPIRFNLRFNLVVERRQLQDGRVWLRYDPALEPRNERVTLYRGGAVIEPLPGGGSRVTELAILGTDLDMPGPFLAPLLKLATDTLEIRATRLWRAAWASQDAAAPR